MSPIVKSFGQGDPQLTVYATETFRPEDEVLREVRNRSAAHGLPAIQVGAMDGLHLEVLARAMGVKRVVEIGSLGGYSTICLARGLAKGGHLWTLEKVPANAMVTKESLERAGFSSQVDVVMGSANETLSSIEKHGPFDLVFIDADKENYPNYLRWARKNLRPGGAVLADNTFAWGLVIAETFESEEARRDGEGIIAFNRDIARDPGWRSTILPTGEGLSLAVRTEVS